MKITRRIAASLIGLAVSLFGQQDKPTLKTSFKTTKSPHDRIRELGTADLSVGVGGFGTVTFKSKDGKLKVTLPVYPPGHVLSTQELDEQGKFQWPANMTIEFHEFMALKQNELGINQPSSHH